MQGAARKNLLDSIGQLILDHIAETREDIPKIAFGMLDRDGDVMTG